MLQLFHSFFNGLTKIYRYFAYRRSGEKLRVHCQISYRLLSYTFDLRRASWKNFKKQTTKSFLVRDVYLKCVEKLLTRLCKGLVPQRWKNWVQFMDHAHSHTHTHKKGVKLNLWTSEGKKKVFCCCFKREREKKMRLVGQNPSRALNN